MKTKKKLLLSFIALGIVAIISIFAISFVSALTQSSASVNLTVSYTANKQINAEISSAYGKGEYGTDLSNLTSLSTLHFYPTTSGTAPKLNTIESTFSLNTWEYFVMKFEITNNRTDNSKIMKAIPTITSSNFVLRYAVSNTNQTISSLSTDGSFNSPTLSTLTSGVTDFYIANGQTKIIYLFFTIPDETNQNASLTNVDWEFTLVNASQTLNIQAMSEPEGTPTSMQATVNLNKFLTNDFSDLRNISYSSDPSLLSTKRYATTLEVDSPDTSFLGNFCGFFTDNTCTTYVNLLELDFSSTLYVVRSTSSVKVDALLEAYDDTDTSSGEVYIPLSAKSIKSCGFDYNYNITKVVIPNSVTTILPNAFFQCRNLTNITIPNSVTSIGYQAFSFCRSLTSINVPNSVTSIDHGVFDGCSSLASINIPNSITAIRYGTFYDCINLTNITIPNSVTSIDYQAFSYCSSLTSINVPNSVTIIGAYAFQYCDNLTSVTFDANNQTGWWVSIDSTATSGDPIDVTNASTNATNLNDTYSGYYWKRSTN